LKDKLCLITGVGPGTGKALVKKFASQGYSVIMVARDAERLASIKKEVPNTFAYPCDVSDEAAVNDMASQVVEEIGEPNVVFHNAVRGTFGHFLEISPSDLEENFRVNTMGMLYLARAFAPSMIERQSGVLMASGNTSALRGKPRFSAFAPSKAAQRILCESLARDLGPKGIHVAYLVIDAVIDLEWTRKMFSEEKDEFFISPDAIADTAYHVAHQERSAWSFNVEVRPFGENW